MSSRAPHQARAIHLRPVPASQPPARRPTPRQHPTRQTPPPLAPERPAAEPAATTPAREPLWRDVVGEVLRRERQAQERTLKDVAEAARISMPYLSELERGRKEASSEILAAAARALGLGLAGLLTQAQDELTRAEGKLTAVHHAPARTSPRGAAGRHGRHGEVRLAVAA